MTPNRPHSDLADLVEASVDQSVDERVLPVVAKLDNAIIKLENITPLLERINKRQNGQETWLIILTTALGILMGYVINHLT